jgi:tetratricopeptide (TPR) repeat protein
MEKAPAVKILVALVLSAGLPLAATGRQAAKPEATSLLGKPLYPASIAPETRRILEENLAKAEVVYGRNPDDADATIWMGRRVAYLGRYREAIDHFSDGAEKHPDDARMYRHRGHRYITVRELPKALADLAKAARSIEGKPDQIEPDGQPNARHTPTSTLNTNIYYHLGLAHYLSGDYEPAASAYRQCLALSKNPDMLVATTYWYYLTLGRLGRTSEASALLARITPDMDIIENASYYKLLRMYQGALPADGLPGSGTGLEAVTMRYGVAAWHLNNGRREQAVESLKQIVDGYPQLWPAFGYVAAEADLARLTKQ